MKPHYQHDCKKCQYLGTLHVPFTSESKVVEIYDFYYCPQCGLPTVIARFSDYGPDYFSGLTSAEGGFFPLNIALLLARKKGLI